MASISFVMLLSGFRFFVKLSLLSSGIRLKLIFTVPLISGFVEFISIANKILSNDETKTLFNVIIDFYMFVYYKTFAYKEFILILETLEVKFAHIECFSLTREIVA